LAEREPIGRDVAWLDPGQNNVGLAVVNESVALAVRHDTRDRGLDVGLGSAL
jgi:hypothetical protein